MQVQKVLLILATALSAAPTSSAQVTPITPAAFGPNATSETFEGELGVTITQVFFPGFGTGAWGPAPPNHTFPSGVQLTGQSASPDEVMVYDYGVPAAYQGPFGLGTCGNGGFFDSTVSTPSGTACLALDNFSNFGKMELTLPAPTLVVGAWVEAGCVANAVARIEVFDSAGNLLGAHQVNTDGVGPNNGLDTFIGVSSVVPIAKVRFDMAGGILDDLTFEACPNATNTPYGVGCPSSGGFPITPELAVTGYPCEGSQMVLEITKGIGGSTALLILGVGQSNIPVGGGCSLLSSPIIGAPIPVPLSGGLPGEGKIAIPVLLPPNLAGTPFTTQAFILDPGAPLGANATNGVHVIIG